MPKPSRPNKTPTSSADARVESRADDTVVLHKLGRQFVFPCAPGREADLMQHVGQLITDPDHPLTWFDAALLCDHLGRRMSDRLSQLPPSRAA